MNIHDLKNKNVVIWGVGREALAAAALIRKFLPEQAFTFIDENKNQSPHICAEYGPLVIATDDLSRVLSTADVIIKSPGVSLYHPLIQQALQKGKAVTSLINLWFSIPHSGKKICVTGTKGKSTVSSLIAHMLTGIGKKAVLLGNIGQALGSISAEGADYIVIEMSSYQTANFEGICDVAVLTSLYPEHLDWHRSLDQYYHDKLELLRHAKKSVVHHQCRDFVKNDAVFANNADGFHVQDRHIFYRDKKLPDIQNRYLLRAHNLENACLALSVIDKVGENTAAALQTLGTFKGLPHRQHELGLKDGILYVDDSISTTPQSAIAALSYYKEKPVTIIAGGHDRGIDYTPLIDFLNNASNVAAVCMGPSGIKIHAGLTKGDHVVVKSMSEAVFAAQQRTPMGGVILLSPAAPSYGLFKDFVERGHAFAKEAGFI